jgi:hypothetical protein
MHLCAGHPKTHLLKAQLANSSPRRAASSAASS